MTLEATIGVRLGTLDLDVQLHVGPGEVVALLGPNGAGKSTILRALAGLLPIDAGRISIDGRTVDDPDADVFVDPEHRPIGVVFQEYLLFDHMTVLENVAYGLRARGIAKRAARASATAWLDRVGLVAYGDQRPRALSGGQAQRVALARALAVSPRLLLLDEPLAALDVGTRAEVRRDLRQHLDSFDGMRVLVTHDPVDAHALADRVAIVEAGRLVQSGTLTELTAHPRSRYVADLVGVNLFTGTVHDGTLTTDSGATIVVADAAPGRAYAVVRPHSITITRAAPLHTSARNTWAGTIVDIDRLGDRARLRLDAALPLTAEVTVAALDDLDLRPGDQVHAAVKATEIEISPA
jgi:molybdate transport system ATP-binding protein